MKISLLAVLGFSTLVELYLGLGVLFKPEMLMQSFGVTAINGEILYMAAIIGWFCLLTTAAAALSAWWVWNSRVEGCILAVVLGIFWVGIGLHLGFGFARPQHFALDAAKGFAIIVLAVLNLRQKPA